jgi:heme/copper-type cytochrome/quinol oxidase subunit 3
MVLAARASRPLAGGGMRPRSVDVSHLPSTGFGPRMTLWWGMIVFIAIEGSVLAMLVATHLYLWMFAPTWPPADTPEPGLVAATVNVLLLAASMGLGYVTDIASKREDARRTLVLLTLMIVVGFASVVLRGFELAALHCWWDSHAYGSIAWTILGVHAVHILAETVENVLLALVFVLGKKERKHFVDVHANMVYWYFVAGGWIPLYVLVFLLPRL